MARPAHDDDTADALAQPICHSFIVTGWHAFNSLMRDRGDAALGHLLQCRPDADRGPYQVCYRVDRIGLPTNRSLAEERTPLRFRDPMIGNDMSG